MMLFAFIKVNFIWSNHRSYDLRSLASAFASFNFATGSLPVTLIAAKQIHPSVPANFLRWGMSR